MKLISKTNLLLILCPAGNALQLQPRHQKLVPLNTFAKHVAATAVVASVVISGGAGPAAAVDDSIYGALETALVDASDATYPVLKSLTDETFSPLANKLVGLATKKMDAGKLAVALDRGADALLGIPDEKVEKFATTVKASYDGVSSSDCSAVPLPVDAIGTFTSAEGVAKLDSSKVAAVTKKLDATIKAIPFSSNGGLCLPASKEGLEKLWIGQTELAINVPRGLKQDFAGAAASAIGSVPNPDLLRVLPDAKKILSGVDAKTAKKFESSSKTLDTVLKADTRFKALSVE